MSLKTKNEISCKNCFYFSKHYEKTKESFIEVNCGHCTNEKVDVRNDENLSKCEFWQYKTIKKQEQSYSLSETLEFILYCLNDIAMILKDKN